MRIALLSWESLHSIYVGGVAVHVSELARVLSRKGHEVHIFTRMGFQQFQYECIDGVHYHRCYFDLSPNFPEEINNMCRSFVNYLFETENLIGRFDIVHAHDWLAANAMIWIKQGRRHKTVFTLHSTEYGRCGNNFAGGHSDAISHIEWAGIYHADRVITVSNTLREETLWLYDAPEEKIHVIYNGVNCENFNGWIDSLAVRQMYDIGAHDPLVLFAGRMVYQKGPDLLMEAIPRVLHQHPDAKFIFSGDGQMRGHVEEMARKMNACQATRFLGQINGWRLNDLFKTADCICVPSRNEPFGIVILEAWSAGKPVIASVNGGPSEFVWHDVNGYKINATPDSTRWGIETMLKDPDHAQWMGQNGRVTAETIFSWEKIAEDTLQVYNKV